MFSISPLFSRCGKVRLPPPPPHHSSESPVARRPYIKRVKSSRVKTDRHSREYWPTITRKSRINLNTAAPQRGGMHSCVCQLAPARARERLSPPSNAQVLTSRLNLNCASNAKLEGSKPLASIEDPGRRVNMGV